MRSLSVLAFCLACLSLSVTSWAESPLPSAKPQAPSANAPKKSILNANIYEKPDDKVRFTDTVRLVRELDGNSEVLFVNKKGIFQAPSDGNAMVKLMESQNHKSPVTVVVDEDSQKILSVLSAAKPAGQ